MISTKVHGYLDYIMGLTLILLPLILNISSGAASAVLVILGAGVIVYSLITDYELGLLKILAMKTHLILDIVGGVLLIAAPWLFGFADEIIWPFVILGVLEIGASLMTKKQPSYESHPHHHKGE
jgi:hypothetical protein